MTGSALLAILLAALAGVLAGRAWATALRHEERRERSHRDSPHYIQGLHYLTLGQVGLALTEFTKVTRADPDALEVLQLLGNLLREVGQVERAIQVHQALLAQPDLTRAETTYTQACLGMDFRKAGFLDRAARTFAGVLEADSNNIHALIGMQKLHEEQRQWREAYDIQTRLSRLRKTDDGLVLGYLQAEMGHEAARAGQRDAAERAFLTALSLDRRVFPAHLGLADLLAPADPRRAAQILEAAIQLAPERAYLAFDRLARVYGACGEPSRFVTLCEGILQRDPHDWRARVALARHLRSEGKTQDAFGLLLRAATENPQVLAVHLEAWRTLRDLGLPEESVGTYIATAEEAVFYADPHICTTCRYRADDMLWRCPHCHEWNTLVEERVAGGGR